MLRGKEIPPDAKGSGSDSVKTERGNETRSIWTSGGVLGSRDSSPERTVDEIDLAGGLLVYLRGLEQSAGAETREGTEESGIAKVGRDFLGFLPMTDAKGLNLELSECFEFSTSTGIFSVDTERPKSLEVGDLGVVTRFENQCRAEDMTKSKRV